MTGSDMIDRGDEAEGFRAEIERLKRLLTRSESLLSLVLHRESKGLSVHIKSQLIYLITALRLELEGKKQP